MRLGIDDQKSRSSPFNRLLIGAALLAVAVFPLLASAQTPSPLTLDQCIALAKAAPSTVLRARQQLLAARQGLLAAKANFLPRVSVGGGFAYNSPLLYDRNQFSFIALNAVREYTTVGASSLEVDSDGRLRALLDRARANEKIAATEVTLSDRDLTRAATTAYYHLLLARRLAASAHENLDVARDFEQKVKNLVAGKEASLADQDKASLEVRVLQNAVQASDLEAEMANHDLAAFWTTDVTKPVALADDLDQEPVAYAASGSDTDFLKRPEFRLFDAQIAGYLADARQARARMLPQLNLAFQYGLDAQQWTGRNRGYAGFAHLDIPVTDWFGAHKEQRQFQFQAKEIETDKAIATRLFSKDYQDALASVKSTYQQTKITESEAQLARENLHLSRLRFENGEGTALDVVSSENSLAQAEIDFYSARADYMNAQMALKVASGQ